MIGLSAGLAVSSGLSSFLPYGVGGLCALAALVGALKLFFSESVKKLGDVSFEFMLGKVAKNS